MPQYAVKTGRSNGFEAPAEIVSGSWYAPTRNQPAVDYKGQEVLGYRILRSLPVVNGHRRWEVECVSCKLKKIVDAHVIRDNLAGDRNHRLAPCKCPDAPLDSGAVRDQFGMTVSQLRTMIAVLTFEQIYQHGPMRLDLTALMKTTVDSAPLVKKGWLVSEGLPQRLTSTEKGRKALGVTL